MITIPRPWNAAPIAIAGIYLGAVLALKDKELKIPPEFAAPTRKPVIAARPFSVASLLLCQLWNMQLGVKAPDVNMKQAK